ncbi:MAG: type II toxin-antitoxin system PemK/MazF family toxin [Nitrospinae bacterium]|nr:type II toxin-antitoxin system PemK/MazF family toxin [Nitrospinota bacterium]
MIQEGQVVLFNFPETGQTSKKLRPALVIRKLPGVFDDWLICMISSQLSQRIPDFDEAINKEDDDFPKSGLKMPSLVRAGRLAVVERKTLQGAIGEINEKRLAMIKDRLSEWIKST